MAATSQWCSADAQRGDGDEWGGLCIEDLGMVAW